MESTSLYNIFKMKKKVSFYHQNVLMEGYCHTGRTLLFVINGFEILMNIMKKGTEIKIFPFFSSKYSLHTEQQKKLSKGAIFRRQYSDAVCRIVYGLWCTKLLIVHIFLMPCHATRNSVFIFLVSIRILYRITTI